jgi:hypothetical protein
VALLSRNAPRFSLGEEQDASSKDKETSKNILLIIGFNIYASITSESLWYRNN